MRKSLYSSGAWRRDRTTIDVKREGPSAAVEIDTTIILMAFNEAGEALNGPIRIKS